MVAHSDPWNRHSLLRSSQIDHAVFRTTGYGGREGLRLRREGNSYRLSPRQYLRLSFRSGRGGPIHLETQIILPGWADPAIFNGRTFRIVYLQDTNRTLKNEAIDIQILSGKHSGYHKSLDARPLGRWLLIPVGAALFGFGLVGLKFKKDDAKSAASDEDGKPAALSHDVKVG